MRALKLVLAAALLTLTTGGLIVVEPEPADALDPSKGYAGFCRDDTGVTVVIDFQALGGTTIVRCNPRTTRGTGLDAMKGAGIEVTGVQRWGEAFICRIENRPSASETIPIQGNANYREQCIDTPPAAGYWSYWHAGNNCRWEYSQWGVKNRDFIPGGFEGWSFSLNATADTNPEPRIAPVRPGTEGGECNAPYEPPPTSDDPHERQPGTLADTGAGSGAEESGEVAPPRPRDRGEAPDPADNVEFTGGDELPAVAEILATESNASPYARIAAIVAIAVLVAAMGLTAYRRKKAREA